MTIEQFKNQIGVFEEAYYAVPNGRPVEKIITHIQRMLMQKNT